jgi:hypothetical protein
MMVRDHIDQITNRHHDALASDQRYRERIEREVRETITVQDIVDEIDTREFMELLFNNCLGGSGATAESYLYAARDRAIDAIVNRQMERRHDTE